MLAIEYGQGADLVLEHEPGGRPRVLVGPGNDHALGHDLAHGELGQQMVDLPHREARGLRGQVQANVAIRDDADQAAALRHEQVPDALLQHGLPSPRRSPVSGSTVIGAPVMSSRTFM